MAASKASSGPGPAVLAWGAWTLRMPPDWRPVKIEGGRDRGQIAIADAATTVAQVKWSRLAGKTFEPKRWLAKRLGRRPPELSSSGPQAEGFRTLAWAPSAKAARGVTRSLWYGYHAGARLLVEVIILADDRPRVRSTAVRDVLPSLEAQASSGCACWSVFGVSFTTPEGFDVAAKDLRSGHMSLVFASRKGPRRGRLVLRQVFPAGLALERKDLMGWLRASPFPERRRFYPSGEPEEWSVQSFGQKLTGIARWGRKRLPWPLGFAGARDAMAAIVRDEQLDRLLTAEFDAPSIEDDEVIAGAIAGMNWAIRPTETG